jgi:hypothetical protein
LRTLKRFLNNSVIIALSFLSDAQRAEDERRPSKSRV